MVFSDVATSYLLFKLNFVDILSFTTKFDNLQKQSEKEIQEVKLLLLEQQKRIKVLEYHIEKNLTEKTK